MVEFAYNNAINASIGYTPFELNCGFHPQALYKKDINFHSQSKSIDKLAIKLRKLLVAYKKNF